MCETGKRQSGTKVRKHKMETIIQRLLLRVSHLPPSSVGPSVSVLPHHPPGTASCLHFPFLISHIPLSLVVCGLLSAVFSVACNAVASVPIFDLPLRIEARPRDIPGPGSCSSNTSGTRRRPTNITCKLCPAARGGRL